jgi:hypothetical protein
LFYGITLAPLATVTVDNFGAPLYGTLGAALNREARLGRCGAPWAAALSRR